jgi:hypothetical protein
LTGDSGAEENIGRQTSQEVNQSGTVFRLQMLGDFHADRKIIAPDGFGWRKLVEVHRPEALARNLKGVLEDIFSVNAVCLNPEGCQFRRPCSDAAPDVDSRACFNVSQDQRKNRACTGTGPNLLLCIELRRLEVLFQAQRSHKTFQHLVFTRTYDLVEDFRVFAHFVEDAA